MFLKSDEDCDMTAETGRPQNRGNSMASTVFKRDLIDYARMMSNGYLRRCGRLLPTINGKTDAFALGLATSMAYDVLEAYCLSWETDESWGSKMYVGPPPAGKLLVVEDGVDRDTLGLGDLFAEIAQLREYGEVGVVEHLPIIDFAAPQLTKFFVVKEGQTIPKNLSGWARGAYEEALSSDGLQ